LNNGGSPERSKIRDETILGIRIRQAGFLEWKEEYT
jgi:hypothetical protein